jgi:enoyl-CoA hydratase/carnithine racemase
VSSFSDYQSSYRFIDLQRDDLGVLLVRLHTDGGPFRWNLQAHEELASLWDNVSRDPDNSVVILTGTGDSFISEGGVFAIDSNWVTPQAWRRIHSVGRRLVMSHLDIEVPVIAAVNGPSVLHSEQALLCDIVLASETATFADHAHFLHGVVPGDGVQVIWREIVGLNRARYLLLTGQVIEARTALEWGVVNEVMDADRLLPRAMEIASVLAAKPAVALRTARLVLTQDLRERMSRGVDLGLMTEGLAGVEYWPSTPAQHDEATAEERQS